MQRRRARVAICSERPLVLDPSNPTNNVAHHVRDWSPLAAAATRQLQEFRDMLAGRPQQTAGPGSDASVA